MYMCSRTVFHNCTFEDSGSAGVAKDDRFRGHAGGLSVGEIYKFSCYSTHATAIICNICV